MSVAPTVSLTGVLLTSSSWEASVQLLLFAAAQRVKILPEALLSAHHVMHPAGNPEMVAALLSHLHRAHSMPYKLPRSAWAQGPPPPERLFFHHVNTQCAQGHWMESIRLLQRTSMRPGLRAMMLGHPRCTDNVTGIASADQPQPSVTPFYGSNLIVEKLLCLWGIDASCAAQPTEDCGALVEASREALWLIASLAPASEVCGVSYFRLMCEVLAHRTTTYSFCCDAIRQSLLLHRRRLVDAPSNLFRCAAQRAALKAVQCSGTPHEVVDALRILTTSGLKADEEVVLEALSRHPTMQHEVVAFARPLAHAFMSRNGLAQCVAAARRGPVSASTIELGVSIVADQWTFLADLGDANSEEPLRMDLEDCLSELLHSKMERAHFLVMLATRHAVGRHRGWAVAVVQQYEQDFADTFRALLANHLPRCEGREPLCDADNAPQVVTGMAQLVSVLSPRALCAWLEQVHTILATPQPQLIKVWVVQLVAQVNVVVGVSAAHLLRIIPRALDILPATTGSGKELLAPNSRHRLFCRLLESCVQRPTAGSPSNDIVDDILIPLLLQFFVSQCGFTWIGAIRHVQHVARIDLGSKYLMMPVASLMSQHTTSWWVNALHIVQQSAISTDQQQALGHHPEAVAVATAALQFWSLQVLLTVVALPQVSAITKVGVALRVLQSPLCEESSVNEVCRSLAATTLSAAELEMVWSSRSFGTALGKYPQLTDVLQKRPLPQVGEADAPNNASRRVDSSRRGWNVL